MTVLYRDLSGNGVGVDLFTPVNRSGTIAAASVAQVLAPANASRRKMTIQNISSNDLWVNLGGTAVIDGAGSVKIIAGDQVTVTDITSTSRSAAASIIGGTLGQKFTCIEE